MHWIIMETIKYLKTWTCFKKANLEVNSISLMVARQYNSVVTELEPEE